MISVVIPTWNEEANLARAIAAVRKNPVVQEIIVVDGGSSDRTQSIAEEMGAHLIVAPVRQRASQMNDGAKNANGEILLFLHADLVLPANGLERVGKSLERVEVVGGGFARRFDSPSLFLKATCAVAELRNRAVGWFFGDQAIFVRRSIFARLGGFRRWDPFEDLDFSRRLGRVGRMVTIRPPVLASARRFEREGPVVRTMRDFLLTLRYLRGDSRATGGALGPSAKEHVC